MKVTIIKTIVSILALVSCSLALATTSSEDSSRLAPLSTTSASELPAATYLYASGTITSVTMYVPNNTSYGLFTVYNSNGTGCASGYTAYGYLSVGAAYSMSANNPTSASSPLTFGSWSSGHPNRYWLSYNTANESTPFDYFIYCVPTSSNAGPAQVQSYSITVCTANPYC